MREVEFPLILNHLRYFATLARTAPGLSMGEYMSGYDSGVRREPVGVCAQVTPWNYPLLMAVWKLGPALAAGNTIVLKPSETTPVTTTMTAEIAAEYLPPGVLNVIVGDRVTGKVPITGSVRAGMEVAAAAAADLKRVHLELGGKAPVLVFPDVDLQSTVRGIVDAGFANAGQDCAAATRLLVHNSIYDEFVAQLVKCAGTTRYGLPDEDVAYGPLNSESQLSRVQGFVDRVPEHAEVVTGGKADRRNGGRRSSAPCSLCKRSLLRSKRSIWPTG